MAEDPAAWGAVPAAQDSPQVWGAVPVDASQQPAPTLSDVPMMALRNLPSSALQFGEDVVQPFVHPIETAESLKNIGLGALDKVGLTNTGHEQYADAVGKFLVDRYGSWDAIKRTMATDPVGIAADVATVLTGGEAVAGRLPGIAGRTAEIAGTVGRTVDPINVATAPVRAMVRNEARDLAQAGVRMTPGQVLSGAPMIGRVFKGLEDAATSIPLLGSFISSGRTRSIESFNRAVANQVLEPIGETVGRGIAAGHDMVSEVESRLGNRYNTLLPNLQFVPDAQLAADIRTIVNRDVAVLPQQQANQFLSIMRSRLGTPARSGVMDGQLYKTVESELRNIAKNYGKSSDAAQRDLGGAIGNVLTAMRDNLERSNPRYADELRQLNTGWAMYARMRAAAARRATSEGVFTPNDLLSAIKAQDSSVGKGAFARGDALMQTFAEAGQAVLPSKLPSSGTSERLAAMGAIGAGSWWLGHPVLALGAAAAAAPYTRPGMWATGRAALGRPPAVSGPAVQVGRAPRIPFFVRDAAGNTYPPPGTVAEAQPPQQARGGAVQRRRSNANPITAQAMTNSRKLVNSGEPISKPQWWRTAMQRRNGGKTKEVSRPFADGGDAVAEEPQLADTATGQLISPSDAAKIGESQAVTWPVKAAADFGQPFVDMYQSSVTGQQSPGKFLPAVGAAMIGMAAPEFEGAGAAAKPFYSAVERALETTKQQKALPSQWLGILKNQPGVKPEELDWLGVEDWLKGQQGAVTKDQLADYVRANKVEVQEVPKGAPLDPRDTTRRLAAQENLDHFHERMQDKYGEFYSPSDLTAEESTLKDALLAERNRIPEPQPTKFQQYTLPGGENYRELLLTLPQQKPDLPPVQPGETFEQWKARRPETPLPFKSTHYDEPNILAHVRFDDRTDPQTGEKILHVAEIQSDWHQAGRKRGYDAPLAAGDFGLRQDRAGTWLVRAGQIPGEFTFRSEADAKTFIDESTGMRPGEITGIQTAAVPDAPFKTTWPELALKRMLRYAAENGYDRISWDTGATNADRYDLSKQVKSIDVVPRYDAATKERTRAISINVGSGDIATHRIGLGLNADGVVDNVSTASAETGNFKGKHISDIVGKELADRIMSTNKGTLSGMDLKVGGEGMKGFYDKILPAAANKLAKKYGARVEQGSVPTRTVPPYDKFVEQHMRSYSGTDPARLPEIYKNMYTGEFSRSAVHSLAITSELRKAAITQGFPLFKQGGAVNRQHGGRVNPSNIDPRPTEAQKKAGNYAKDHVRIHGLDLTIENAKGAKRFGKDRDGKPWSVTMPAHYGYIKGTVGRDKDHVDVYLGPHPKSPKVFVVDQLDAETGKFDEHKAFIGFTSKISVIDCYQKAFSDGKAHDRLGHIRAMTVDEFKQWLNSGNTAKPVAGHKAAA